MPTESERIWVTVVEHLAAAHHDLDRASLALDGIRQFAARHNIDPSAR